MLREHKLKEHLATFIAKKIKSKGWTQEYIALEVGLSQSTISKIVNMKLNLINISTLTEIVKYLGYDIKIKLTKI